MKEQSAYGLVNHERRTHTEFYRNQEEDKSYQELVAFAHCQPYVSSSRYWKVVETDISIFYVRRSLKSRVRYKL
jgi:hypothetical protein